MGTRSAVTAILTTLIASQCFALAVSSVGKIGAGELKDPMHISAALDGTLVVTDAEGDKRSVVRFSPEGRMLGKTEIPAQIAANGAVLASSGALYLASRNNHGKVWVLKPGRQPEEISDNGIDIDLQKVRSVEYLYMLKRDSAGVQRLALSSGEKTDVAFSEKPDKGGLNVLRVRPNGDLYAYSGSARVVYRYDAEGRLKGRFGSGGDLHCGIPAGHIGGYFDVDSAGEIYWSLADYGTLLKYTADGKTGFHYRGQEAWNIRWTGPIHTLSGFVLHGDRGYIIDRQHKRITSIPKSTLSDDESDCDKVDTRVFGLRLSLVTDKPYKLFTTADTDLRIRFDAGIRRCTKVDVECRVRDLDMKVVDERTVACEFENDDAAEFPLAVRLEQLGWYQVDLALKVEGDLLMERIHFVGRTQRSAARPIPAKEVSGWEDVDTHCMIGMGLHRFGGDRIRKNVDETKQNIGRAKQLNVPFFLQIENKAEATPEHVRFLIETYPDMDVLEIVNEPNLNTSPEDYVQILKACYEEAKRLRPELKILGPAQCGTALGWFTAFFAEGGGRYVDGVSVHTYMRHNSMDAYHWSWKLAKLREIMAEHECGSKPLYQTEHGFLGDYHGHCLRQRWQGRSLFLELMITDRFGMWPDKYYYYYVNDGGFGGFSAYLVNNRRELLPAAMLMRSRALQLDDRRYDRALDFGQAGNRLVLGNVYTGAKTDLIVLVNNGALKHISVDLDLPATAKAFDSFGNPLPLRSSRGKARVAVGRYPTYIELPSGSAVIAQMPGFYRNIAGGAEIEVADAYAAKRTGFLTNGVLEYDFEDEPERDGFRATPKHLPLDVTFAFDSPRSISDVVVYGSMADNDKTSPVEYDVFGRVNGAWKRVDSVKVEVEGRVTKLEGLIKRITWYDNPWIFTHHFEPIQADAIRLSFKETTFGQWPVKDVWWGPLDQRVHLREVEIYTSKPDVELRLSTEDETLAALRPVKLRAEVVLNEPGRIRGSVSVSGPEGWTIEPEAQELSVSKVGTREVFEFRASPPAEVAAGPVKFVGQVLDARQARKDVISTRLEVLAPAEIIPQTPTGNAADGWGPRPKVRRLQDGAFTGTLHVRFTGASTDSAQRRVTIAANQGETDVEFPDRLKLPPGRSGVIEYRLLAADGRVVTARQTICIVPYIVAGPFDNKDGKGFDAEYPPEKRIDRRATFTTVDGRSGWKRALSDASGKVEFAPLLKTTQNVAAYALTYVRSPTARKATLSCGSDDGIKAWVNEKLVISHDIGRGAAPGQEQVTVDLKKGWNTILLKITQGGGGWGLYQHLLDENGMPLPDIEYADGPGTR